MDDIPDWLRHWIALKAIEHFGSRFWNTYGKVWCQTANHNLLRLYVYLYVWQYFVLAAILDSITAPHSPEEIDPATNYNAVTEAIRENSPSFIPKIDPFALIRNSFQGSVKLDPFSPIRNGIWNSIKPPILRMKYEPFRFQYVPPRFSYQPMRMSYKLPMFRFNNGFLRFTPANLDFKPPIFKVTPASFKFSPGGFRLGN